MKDYASKITEGRNHINDMLKKNDNEFLIAFLDSCDDSLYEMFTETMDGNIRKLRRFLRNVQIMVEVE